MSFVFMNYYLFLVIVVAIFQFFVGHELNCAVDNTEEAGGESLVEARESLVLGDLDKGIDHARVVFAGVNIAGKLLLQTESIMYQHWLALCSHVTTPDLVLTTVMGLVNTRVMRPATEAATKWSPVPSCLALSPFCSLDLMV